MLNYSRSFRIGRVLKYLPHVLLAVGLAALLLTYLTPREQQVDVVVQPLIEDITVSPSLLISIQPHGAVPDFAENRSPLTRDEAVQLANSIIASRHTVWRESGQIVKVRDIPVTAAGCVVQSDERLVCSP